MSTAIGKLVAMLMGLCAVAQAGFVDASQSLQVNFLAAATKGSAAWIECRAPETQVSSEAAIQ